MTGRLKESYKESKETIKKKNFKEYLLDVILYVKNPKSDEPGLDDTEQVRREKKRAKAYGVRYHDALKQVWIGQVNVNIAEMFSDRLVYDQEENGEKKFWEIIRNYGTIEKFIRHYNNRLLTIEEDAKLMPITDEERRDFFHMSWVLRTDPAVMQSSESWGENYIVGIYIKRIHDVNLGEVPVYDRRTARQRDTTKISRRFSYLTTELDLSKDTFKEAIQYKQYIQNECWINTLYDFYGDNLLSQDKKRNYISRSMILEIIGKTEENVKEGISIHDMLPFFEKFRLQVKVFDQFYKLVFTYYPPIRNHHNKVLYCLMDSNHIYTLNHNIKRLEQVQDVIELDYAINPSTDYRVKDEEEEKHKYHKMISSDFIKILKEHKEANLESQIVYLVHQEDDLMGMLYELINEGYKPQIKYETGRITHLILEFNGHIFILRTQQLITSVIQYPVVVESETIYNKMNEAMVKFNSHIFKATHKSYYTQLDIDILDEYRTVANIGMIRQKPKEKLNEIDVSKAYTGAFCKITHIPIFNEFDSFQPYTGQPIEDYSLYVIKAKSLNMMFNKDYNLCYGFFLKDFSDIEIKAFKKPHTLKRVNYKKFVDDLFATPISDNKDEDNYIKKLIANINFGLLEKSQNKQQRTFYFDDLSELKHYQSQYGGRLNIISRFEDVLETQADSNNSLDKYVEDDDVITTTTCKTTKDEK